MTNEEALDILERQLECANGNCPEPQISCIECPYNVDAIDYNRACKMAIEALSKQSASSKQADQCGNDTEMVELKKRTITERLIIAKSLIDSVIADSNQFREDTKKTDSERVSLSEQEKSNSFPEEPPAEGNFEMNCSDAPDIRVGKIPYKKPEIICCKDCRYRDPEDKKCDHGHGIVWQLPRPDDWFCADGKA